MLQELISYADTGSESCLMAMQGGITLNTPFGRVPDDTANKVIALFMDALQSNSGDDKRTLVWHILSSLCNDHANSAAPSFRRKLDNSSVLSCAAEACGNYESAESRTSICFLLGYTDQDALSHCVVLQSSRLLAVLLWTLDTSVAAVHIERAKEVLRLFECVLQSDGPLEEFVKAGGFAKLNSAAEKLVWRGVVKYKKAASVGEELKEALGIAVLCVIRLQHAFGRQLDTWVCKPPAEKAMICYTIVGAKRFSMLLHYALDIIQSVSFGNDMTMAFFPNIYAFLRHFIQFTDRDSGCTGSTTTAAQARARALDELEDYCLNAPSPLSGGCFMSRLLYEIRLNEQAFGPQLEWVLCKLDALTVTNPNMKEFLEAKMGEKLEYCSMPGCNVTNLKRSRLKKCDRCRSASYCSREHQVTHWKQHKRDCCKTSPAAAAAGAATGANA